MKFIKQKIPDVILINPAYIEDSRGYFAETFRQDLFEDFIGYKVNFLQENESKSCKGVLRGLHYQLPPFAQSKLVKVIDGKVLDIALDIRRSSPTFKKYVSVELSADNKNQLFIPHGFAHGFVVLSESATFVYKVDNFYAPEFDRGIAYDDPDLNIDWWLPLASLELSTKDKAHPKLSQESEIFD